MSFSEVNCALIDHFGPLEDPRDQAKARHQLLDMIVMAVAAVICGADDWVSIAQFARAKEGWLRKFLALENGIPSHDTFGRVFSLLAPEAFEQCFRDWVNAVRRSVADEVVAIDGKCVRRSHDRSAAPSARNGLNESLTIIALSTMPTTRLIASVAATPWARVSPGRTS